uniref:Uncharacterized protein n=1 Tax=Cacopsylla melanoneura TaxID=428564 RepID=A0A8D8U7K3_9HEMI
MHTLSVMIESYIHEVIVVCVEEYVAGGKLWESFQKNLSPLIRTNCSVHSYLLRQRQSNTSFSQWCITTVNECPLECDISPTSFLSHYTQVGHTVNDWHSDCLIQTPRRRELPEESSVELESRVHIEHNAHDLGPRRHGSREINYGFVLG